MKISNIGKVVEIRWNEQQRQSEYLIRFKDGQEKWYLESQLEESAEA